MGASQLSAGTWAYLGTGGALSFQLTALKQLKCSFDPGGLAAPAGTWRATEEACFLHRSYDGLTQRRIGQSGDGSRAPIWVRPKAALRNFETRLVLSPRSNWIDFRTICQTVTMESVLRRYGVHSPKVPYSLIVDTSKNVWACHSDSRVLQLDLSGEAPPLRAFAQRETLGFVIFVESNPSIRGDAHIRRGW